ncbi:hypothetical protein CSKR_110982 [Clonorchis sinensis]|uniref:C2H2-type domain-containing protein n=1 Tax=Clonorchis sinensis TaxID=79923 RepID=A0A8T1MCV2_CLOSI|nr:hypothetical protein CSKR_110982 [Clonorchis sinensis]
MGGRDSEAAINILEKSPTRYVCTLCAKPETPTEEPSLEVHCVARHPNSTQISCVYCARLVSVTAINKHIDRHFSLSDQEPYPCPLCPRAYGTLRSFAQHAVFGHHVNPALVFYKCGHCNAATGTPIDLSAHLNKYFIALYHCNYPNCLVKSTHRDLVLKHCSLRHGNGSAGIVLTRMFSCSLSNELCPSDCPRPQTQDTSESSPRMTGNCSLFCPQCSFGTHNLENFAEHFGSCLPLPSQSKNLRSLSVTCSLHHCSVCGWITSAKNMLLEHLHESHPGVSEVIREDEDSVIRPASLADCRRHILGVHARIPQDLLTLCCQASRISKESGYKLYSDSSLLALAEQHKFRSARMQTYNKAGSPFRAANSADTSGANTDEYDMSSEKPPPSPDTSGRLGSNNVSYTSVSRLPSVGNRPPNWKQDPETDASGLDGPACTDLHNGSPPTQKAEPIAAATHKMENVNSQALAARHSGLDLEAPHRILTVDEAVSWGRNLSLPTTWTLERIVRLQYNESVFDEQLRRLLPNNELFVESLHERMRVYSRHAVYIARLHTTASPPQRIYVCCACLSTSQHGFGDVRKHILGVHAHIPERFKTIAMNSSRLNREDYSLQTENSAPISSRSSSSSHSRIRRTTLRKTGLNNLTSQHSSRKRSLTAVGSPVLRSHVTSPPRKKACSGDVPVGESFFSNGNESIRSPSDLHEDATSHTHLNGTLSPSGSKAPFREDPSRPPIILMLPRPKAFHPSRSPEQSDFSISGSDMERTLGDDLISAEASRSRRSMILKSKRPCPTTT